MRQTKSCFFCGEKIERKENVRDSTWESRKYCDLTCSAKDRRVNTSSYLNQFLMEKDVVLSAVIKEAREVNPYFNSNIVYRINTKGIGYGQGQYSKIPNEVIARDLAAAVSMVCSGMKFEDGADFDYRLIMNPVEGGIWVDNDSKGALGGIVTRFGLQKDRVIKDIKEMITSDYKLRQSLEVVHEEHRDDIACTRFPDAKAAWKKVTVRKYWMTARLAVAITRYLNSEFNLIVDYRSLLPEVRASQIRSIFK